MLIYKITYFAHRLNTFALEKTGSTKYIISVIYTGYSRISMFVGSKPESKTYINFHLFENMSKSSRLYRFI